MAEKAGGRPTTPTELKRLTGTIRKGRVPNKGHLRPVGPLDRDAAAQSSLLAAYDSAVAEAFWLSRSDGATVAWLRDGIAY